MEESFTDFNHWVENQYQLHLEDYKDRQMQRRIRNIMTQNHVSTLHEYQQLLTNDPVKRTEFIEHLTINVTEFYRNQELFSNFENCLVERLLPQFKHLKLWSAACSTGAEPYTLAMILAKHQVQGQILATDIDEQILQKAQRGQFSSHELKNVSATDLRHYFQAAANEQYQITDVLRQQVTFKKHDLLADRYETGFHVIVCRNVTIYFKPEARDRVYRQLAAALVPGGLLFMGATETLTNAADLGLEKIAAFIYQKSKF